MKILVWIALITVILALAALRFRLVGVVPHQVAIEPGAIRERTDHVDSGGPERDVRTVALGEPVSSSIDESGESLSVASAPDEVLQGVGEAVEGAHATTEELAPAAASADRVRDLSDGFYDLPIDARQRERGYVRNGRRTGTWEFTVEGVRVSECTYVDGVLNGPGRSWSLSGVLVMEYNLLDGELDGDCRFWNPDGTVDPEQNGRYRAGVKVADL